MFDYSIFYKDQGSCSDLASGKWDFFISAFNSSERVRAVYDSVSATRKLWFVQADYGYTLEELPTGCELVVSESLDEVDLIARIASVFQPSSLVGKRVCIDITGFIKPYMMVLIKWLSHIGCSRFDVLYSEPVQYAGREETKFSDEVVQETRTVAGFAGIHSPLTSNDVLIVGAGYDDHLICFTAEHKLHARKYQMIGFPSLSADMYQENLLNLNKAAESMSSGLIGEQTFRAPANDPFVTASVLSEAVLAIELQRAIDNLYLSPLATKPQALGFVLYYLREKEGSASSIIYPFSAAHEKVTSKGFSKVWKYGVDLR